MVRVRDVAMAAAMFFGAGFMCGGLTVNAVSKSRALAETIAASNDAVIRDSLSHPIVVPVDAPLNPVRSGQVSTAATGVRPIGVATHGYMVASGVGPDGEPAEIKVNKFGYVLCVGP